MFRRPLVIFWSAMWRDYAQRSRRRGRGVMNGGGCAVNMQKLIRKLQTALCVQGRKIRINQYQHYSDKRERMVTKYVLSEEKIIKEKRKTVEIATAYQTSEVVKILAGLLEGGGGA